MHAPYDDTADNLCLPEKGALPCDAFHHHYHYQSSAQYTLLAHLCFALGKKEEMQLAISKALFQDHYNEEALELRASGFAGDLPRYAKHPLTDAEFCANIGKPATRATQWHDEAMALMERDPAAAQELLEKLVRHYPTHSNGRFRLAQLYAVQNLHKQAYTQLIEAIRLSHEEHDGYHQTASGEHVARGAEFARHAEYDLAINEFHKALDLHRGNAEAKEAIAHTTSLRDA